jgi:hypothetical protein
MDPQILDWLLEKSDPSVRFRALTQLLDLPASDPAVTAARAALMESEPVRRIFDRLGPDGLWPHDTKNYKSLTTGNYLITLAELGVSAADPRLTPSIERVFEAVLSYMGDYCVIDLCLAQLEQRALLQMGFDPADERMVMWFRRLDENLIAGKARLCRQWDEGFTPKANAIPSCYRANIKGLMVYAERARLGLPIPDLSPLLEYLWARRVIYSTPACDRVEAHLPFVFPVEVSRIPLFMFLHAFSILGCGDRPELKEAWDLVESRRGADGRFALDEVNARPLIWGTKKDRSSKWVTFYVELALKHRLAR